MHGFAPHIRFKSVGSFAMLFIHFAQQMPQCRGSSGCRMIQECVKPFNSPINDFFTDNGELLKTGSKSRFAIIIKLCFCFSDFKSTIDTKLCQKKSELRSRYVVSRYKRDQLRVYKE